MNLDFPTEVVREGKTNVVVPKLKAYVKEAWEYAPSKAPVFYNPAMELNRDLAVLTLQTYQRKMGKEISICEPLAGCGIRSVRFAMEVEGIRKIVVNDINPQAAELAKLNMERNKLTEHVSVTNEDANLLLSRYAAPRTRFDFVDVDPFGSPVPYMDSAVRASRDDGLLALTATDMAPLCGVHPKACVRKYGGKPLRTSYCHELAVRLLAGCLTMTAAKHEKGVEVILSHSTDHYVRVYTVVSHGAKQADKSVKQMGHILHCFTCLHREVSKRIFSPWRQDCIECGSKLNAAGPLWLGKIFDEEFCALMEKEVVRMNLGREKRIRRLLSLARIEAEAPITYYAVDKVCDKLNLRIPLLIKTIDELKAAGFQATPTHFNSRGIRTNAPAKTVKEIITKLVT